MKFLGFFVIANYHVNFVIYYHCSQNICDYKFTIFTTKHKDENQDWWIETKLGIFGSEIKYDLENLWNLGIDPVKNIPILQAKQTSGGTSYKLAF